MLNNQRVYIFRYIDILRRIFSLKMRFKNVLSIRCIHVCCPCGGISYYIRHSGVSVWIWASRQNCTHVLLPTKAGHLNVLNHLKGAKLDKGAHTDRIDMLAYLSLICTTKTANKFHVNFGCSIFLCLSILHMFTSCFFTYCRIFCSRWPRHRRATLSRCTRRNWRCRENQVRKGKRMEKIQQLPSGKLT